MDKISIDLSNYKELSTSYLKNLSGYRMLTYDIIDQNGKTLFQASEVITLEAIEEKAAQGKKFFIPKAPEASGSYGHEIVSKRAMAELADETFRIYNSVRQNGTMSHNEYINTHKSLGELTSGLKKEDRHGGVLPLLRELKELDYYTYTHSVNVGVLAVTLFYKLGYPAEKVQNLAVAGYLHDIGKLLVPDQIINKAGRLTSAEFNSMMEHTRGGYRILDEITDSMENRVVQNTTKLTALFHHRKYKNRGYPTRKDRDKNSEAFYQKLPEEVRLIGICDAYDAITTTTHYRKGISHRDGLRHILNSSNYHYTIDDVYKFLKPMILTLNKGEGIFKNGDYIVLETEAAKSGADGRKEKNYEFARVIGINKNNPLEPSIRIFYDASKNREIRSIEIDLRKDYGRKIARVINDDKLKEMFGRLFK